MISVNTCCLQLLNSICVAEKATKGTELQFLCTQGTLQGGRVEDHRMMFTRHLHLPQSHIQAKLYIYVEQPTSPFSTEIIDTLDCRLNSAYLLKHTIQLLIIQLH